MISIPVFQKDARRDAEHQQSSAADMLQQKSDALRMIASLELSRKKAYIQAGILDLECEKTAMERWVESAREVLEELEACEDQTLPFINDPALADDIELKFAGLGSEEIERVRARIEKANSALGAIEERIQDAWNAAEVQLDENELKLLERLLPTYVRQHMQFAA
ncbi:hypothetical protein Salmuc_02022 [Salipiger mucosus DSM 16094]|uniref:Uncharacterized protein n=1 Tax=Salipiger mucosus DSM 16094 TaxID=1123237 RepID=S9SAY7_9RHOB|nr:hypothetical protein Salmuc_02022 [Salipiger mucosus DSM 16094]